MVVLRRVISRRRVPLAVLACLLVACAPSPTAHATSPTPVLPGAARIVRTVDVTLPPVPAPPSTLPGIDQRAVVFVDSHIGFLATGGHEQGNSQGGTYNPAAGGIQRTVDGGKSWQTVWTTPGVDIGAISFVSRSTGFAAGTVFSASEATIDQGRPIWLRTGDAGASWSPLEPHLPADGIAAWSTLHFVAASANLILGAPNPNEQAGGDPAIMLRSSDAGSHWSQVGPPGWTPTGGIAFATPSIAFATGSVIPSEASATSARLWTSRDGGQSWGAVPGTDLPFDLLAVDFPDSMHGYAAGGNLAKYEMRPWRAVIATADAGHSWTTRYQSTDADRSNPITVLRFLDADHGWASIGRCSEGQNGPCGGPVILTNDGGYSWRTTDRTAVDLSAPVISEAWAVDGRGPGSFLWHTTDAGSSWSAVVRPGTLGIGVLAGSRGWLVAATPAGIWQSADDGGSWSPLDSTMLTPFVQDNGSSLVAQPPGLLVLTDYSGLRISHDAGGRFFDVTLPGQDLTSSPQIVTAFWDATHGFAAVGAQLCTKPPGYTGSGSEKPPAGVPQGAATLDLTMDGGTNWTRQGALDVQPLGVAVAPGVIAITGSAACPGSHQVLMLSHDDGRHWATQALPQTCLRVGVAAPGTIWLDCFDSLLVTQDWAMTWTSYRFAQGMPSILPLGRSEAWAYGPTGGLWHTTNGLHSWVAVTPGF